MREETREMLKKRQETVYRMNEAVQRILEVSTELHLTWRQFEDVLSQVKEVAYISSGIEPAEKPR